MILLYLILDKALLSYEGLKNEKQDFIGYIKIPHCKCGSYVLGTTKRKWEQNHVALLPCPPCTHEAHSSMSMLGCTGPPPRGGLRHPPSPRRVGLGRTGPRPARRDGCGGLNRLPPHRVGLARTPPSPRWVGLHLPSSSSACWVGSHGPSSSSSWWLDHPPPHHHVGLVGAPPLPRRIGSGRTHPPPCHCDIASLAPCRFASSCWSRPSCPSSLLSCPSSGWWSEWYLPLL